MKEFPKKLIPGNREKFTEYKFNRELCKLRQKVVEYLYSGDKGGLDLKSSKDGNGLYDYSNIDERLIATVRNELEKLGWKTNLAYGNTTLFIYEKDDEIPHSLQQSEEIDF